MQCCAHFVHWSSSAILSMEIPKTRGTYRTWRCFQLLLVICWGAGSEEFAKQGNYGWKKHFSYIRRELACSTEINLVHENLIQAIRISKCPVSCISNLSWNLYWNVQNKARKPRWKKEKGFLKLHGCFVCALFNRCYIAKQLLLLWQW